MSIERYKQQLDEVRADEDFKQHTLNRLRLAQENPALLEEQSSPIKRRLPRQWRQGLALASFALVAVLCWQVGGPLLNRGAAVPVAEPEARLEAAPETAPATPPSSSQLVASRLPSNYFANSTGGSAYSLYGDEAQAPEGGEAAMAEEPPQEEPPSQQAPADSDTSTSTVQKAPSQSTAKPADAVTTSLVTTSAPPPQKEVQPPESEAGHKPDAETEQNEGSTSLPTVEVPVFSNEAPSGEAETPIDPPADILLGYDVDDVTHDETETEPPEELPVYRSPVADDADAFDADALSGLLAEQAGALGLAVASVDTVDEDAMEADCGEATIRAYADGSVNISFSQPMATSAATADEVNTDALVAEYAELLAGMQQPVAETMISVYPRGVRQRSVNIYDGGDDDTGAVFTRSLSGARLLLDEDGNVVSIQLWRADTFDKLGDYPLITEDEATALLAEGHGITSLPFEFPGVEAIEAVGMEYVYTGAEEYVLPYYKYYVTLQLERTCELLEDEEPPAVSGVWYVPAISPDYVE